MFHKCDGNMCDRYVRICHTCDKSVRNFHKCDKYIHICHMCANDTFIILTCLSIHCFRHRHFDINIIFLTVQVLSDFNP